MCGIVGILDPSGARPPHRNAIEGMLRQVSHRGPDDSGVYVDQTVGLGHARLGIIDIEGGHQPIHNEDSSVWLVFSGEVFNYIELRQDLRRAGHIFYTDSDTEVIVHLYEEHGDDFVQHINGQFAIALWDRRRSRLILARDRVGILPLFYLECDGRLYFASEIKALLAVSPCEPRPSLQALDEIFTLWNPVSPRTMFEGIYEVPPGSILVARNGHSEVRGYWAWNFPEDGEYHAGSLSEQVRELQHLLIDATRLRLRSDVPVGVYLSGGLDSSIVASVIARHFDRGARTFSVAFDDERFDESRYQRILAGALKAQRTEVRCADSDIAEALFDAIWNTECPILRTAPVPLKRLSASAHEHGYKVVLTGEGADEVFGGYDIFKEAKIRSFWARQPSSSRRPLLLKRLYPYLDFTRRESLAYLSRFFGVGLDDPEQSLFSHLPRWASTSLCKEFFSDGLKVVPGDAAVNAVLDLLPPEFGHWHPFNRAQYLEAKLLLPGYILSSQGDRMLMASSVEGRFPFLDHRVIEFASRIHPRAKMRVLQEKYLLKKAMEPYVPRDILVREKQPYRAPDAQSFAGDGFPEYAEELLGRGRIASYGYFDPEKVQHLVRKVERGAARNFRDNSAFIGILTTQVWHHLFIDRGRATMSGREQWERA